MVFSAVDTQKTLTPWGIEVKKKLLEKHMKQDTLVSLLREAGFVINKYNLTHLLYGTGVSARQGEIRYISDLLDITYNA